MFEETDSSENKREITFVEHCTYSAEQFACLGGVLAPPP
jgi:hypothetical protein